MSDSSTLHSKTSPTILAFASRSRLIEGGRLTGILNLAKTIFAAPPTTGFLAERPSRFRREHLQLSKQSGNTDDSLFGRIAARNAAFVDGPWSVNAENDHSNPRYLSPSGLLAVALRRLESDLNATRTPALAGEGDAGDRHAQSNTAHGQTPDRHERRRSIYQQLAARGTSPSNEPQSVTRGHLPHARERWSLTRRAWQIAVSGNNRGANRTSQLFPVGEIVRALTNLWMGVNRLVQAIRPSLEVRARSSRSAAGRARVVAFPVEGGLVGDRDNRHSRLAISNRSSHAGSIDGRDTAKGLTRSRLAFTDTSALFGTTLPKRWLAVGLGAQLGRGWFGSSQAELLQSVRTLPRATRAGGNPGGMRNPITISFSPTIVVSNNDEHGSLEGQVLEAIGRHSYELVRLIGREVQTQRRAVF
jgi:hypothetical protein